MTRVRPRRRWPSLVLGGVLGAVLATIAVSQLSPWPSALVIRWMFTQDGARTAERMMAYVPDVELVAQEGLAYGHGPFRTLDAFRPASATAPLPVVVWIHGGAWISGSTGNVDPYVQMLAAHGYATVALDYTIGPEGVYPTAVEDVSAGLAWMLQHAGELGIDPSRVVLAGDSAGAQLASQIAALTTDASYAARLGIASPLSPDQLRGIVLNCGIYDLPTMAKEQDGLIAWGFRSALWAYTGTKDWAVEPGLDMSAIEAVTPDFPPTWISGGNGDALTDLQSKPFAARLEDAGVPVTALFWPEELTPALGHEYQFHLERPEAREAFESTVTFLRSVVPIDDPLAG